MKEYLATMAGVVGAAIAAAFGGWNSALTTLCILMLADYVTGLIVACVFHNSPKTESGLLDSHACWKGLIKKCMVLLFVLIAARLDLVVGTSYLKDAVCIAYIVSECISLIENAGLMGVPVPDAIKNAIAALKDKTPEG